MSEEEFEVAIEGGVRRGRVGGDGPPALLLHGGAAVPDYLEALAAARVELIQVCAHFPWLERPGEVARAVATMVP